MNTNYKQMDDDARFDRLVDGAFSPSEYKAFVAALEDEPGGWRRCAMAFLEAQAWGKEFAAIRRMEEMAVRPADAKPIFRRAKIVSPGTLLCAAASFVLAFGLGLFSYSKLFPPDVAATTVIAKAPHGTGVAKKENQLSPSAPESFAFEEMHLVVDRGEGLPPEEIVVPVRESRNPGAEALVETEPAISDSILRSLRLRGHRITRKQEFIPIPLEDGRQVIFPVEQYQITPVSSKSY